MVSLGELLLLLVGVVGEGKRAMPRQLQYKALLPRVELIPTITTPPSNAKSCQHTQGREKEIGTAMLVVIDYC